jgi:hypothetical protein
MYVFKSNQGKLRSFFIKLQGGNPFKAGIQFKYLLDVKVETVHKCLRLKTIQNSQVFKEIRSRWKPFINVLRWNSVQNSRMCKDRNQSFFKNVQGGNPFKVKFGSSNINVWGVNRFIFHKYSRWRYVQGGILFK